MSIQVQHITKRFGDFVALESERHVSLVTGPSFQAGIEQFLARRET